jgi:hypothetical protein
LNFGHCLLPLVVLGDDMPVLSLGRKDSPKDRTAPKAVNGRTTENPEALQQLAQMSPSERSRWLSKLEGHLEAEMRIAQQLQGQQQAWQQERRTTHAPPPIRPPRGGANPPSDLHRMASREDVTDYVRMR